MRTILSTAMHSITSKLCFSVFVLPLRMVQGSTRQNVKQLSHRGSSTHLQIYMRLHTNGFTTITEAHVQITYVEHLGYPLSS